MKTTVVLNFHFRNTSRNDSSRLKKDFLQNPPGIFAQQLCLTAPSCSVVDPNHTPDGWMIHKFLFVPLFLASSPPSPPHFLTFSIVIVYGRNPCNPATGLFPYSVSGTFSFVFFFLPCHCTPAVEEYAAIGAKLHSISFQIA